MARARTRRWWPIIGVFTVIVVGSVVGAIGAEPDVTPPPSVGEPSDPAATASGIPTASAEASGTATASADATPTASSDATPEPTAAGEAEAAALALTVKGRAPKTGYDREQFGPAWVDVDRNGCDTRNDELRARLTDLDMSGSCKVMSGTLDDLYTGSAIHFVRGGASEVDIDHIVALSDAWQKGAAQWEYAKRVAFANDPLNLEPADAGANREKGDSDAASWLPPNKAWRCDYVARQVAVKTKYEVWVTKSEQAAMLAVLETCPDQSLPSFGDQPVIADNTGGPAPSDKGTKAPEEGTAPEEGKASDATDPQYPYCKDAIAAGYGPYVNGEDPEYNWYSDRDADGVVCES